MAKMVVINLLAALKAIQKGTLTGRMLGTALFYMDVSREYALGLSNTMYCELDEVTQDRPEQERIRGVLVRALRKAEAEGRTMWCSLHKDTCFKGLNTLLKRNGIKPLDFSGASEFYTYPDVVKAAKASSSEMEIIC